MKNGKQCRPRSVYNVCPGLSVKYRYDPKSSDRYVWANSADPDQIAPRLEEQSDQGLHCLQFWLHLLGALLFGKATVFKLYSKFFWVSEFYSA